MPLLLKNIFIENWILNGNLLFCFMWFWNWRYHSTFSGFHCFCWEVRCQSNLCFFESSVLFFSCFFFKICSFLFSILIYYVVSGCGLRFNYLAWKILMFLKLKIYIYIFALEQLRSFQPSSALIFFLNLFLLVLSNFVHFIFYISISLWVYHVLSFHAEFQILLIYIYSNSLIIFYPLPNLPLDMSSELLNLSIFYF